MKLKNFLKPLMGALLLASVACLTANAASMKISIGIRETGTAGAIFSNGGTTNGIEHVKRDAQTFNLDGTWQQFSFTPASDPLTGFAGNTANHTLEPGLEWAVLEHIRLLNDEGITKPVRIWIDDVTNTVSTGPVVQNFDSSTLGSEVMFQEPNFSGSTAGFLAPGSVTAVSNSAAFSGNQSLQMDFQFINATPTNWVRLSTFATPNQPNPRIQVREAGQANPTVSFQIRGVAIPEPASMALIGLAGIALGCIRTKR